MEAGLTEEALKAYINSDTDEPNLQTEKINRFKNRVRKRAVEGRQMLEIDYAEGRAIYNRTTCSTLNEIVELMVSFKNKNRFDRFYSLLKASLIFDKRVKALTSKLEAISKFKNTLDSSDGDYVNRSKFNNSNSQIAIDNQELGSNTQRTDKLEIINTAGDKNSSRDTKTAGSRRNNIKLGVIDEESLNYAYQYLPFWDVDMTRGSTNAKYLGERLQLKDSDFNNFKAITNCTTLREVIKYYQNNRHSLKNKLFSVHEVAELRSKGVINESVQRFSDLVVFLAAQEKKFPKEILQFLQKEKFIVKIDLRKVGRLTMQTLRAIFFMIILVDHPLKRIDISNSQIKQDIGQLLVQLHSRNQCQLQEMQVSDNELRVNFFKLINTIKYKNSLISLSLAHCNANSTSIIKIHELFEDNTRLSFLNVSGNVIVDQSMIDLLTHLKRSASLKYLNISDNACGDKIIPVLGEFLSECSNLEVLEFEDNLNT